MLVRLFVLTLSVICVVLFTVVEKVGAVPAEAFIETVVPPKPVTNPVPVITTVKLPKPCACVAGLTSVIFGPVFTVNAADPVALAPSPFTTVTVPAPVEALPEIVMLAVSDVPLFRVVELTVMPGFENTAWSDAPATNPVPVIVTLPVKPWPRLVGFTAVTVASGSIVIDKLFDVDAPAESVTVNDTLVVPVAVGVPVIAPVLALSDNPAGRAPELNEYGEVPPVAVSVAAYGTVSAPLGSEVFEIVGGARIVMLYVVVVVPPAPSLILICTLEKVPLTVGVPVMEPVLAPIDNPAGRPVADHV